MKSTNAIQEQPHIEHFKAADIPDDVLKRLLQVMRLAPSTQAERPWTFVIVKDPARKSKIAAACVWQTARGRSVTQSWIEEAPVAIVVCVPKPPPAYLGPYAGETAWTYDTPVDADLVIALDYLAMAAAMEGIEATWIGTLNEPELREILEVPNRVHISLAMALGYPISWKGPKPRRPLEAMICYEHYCGEPTPHPEH